MISVLELKNLELYKNSIYYPVGKENKNTGTAIFLTSQNSQQTMEMITDRFVRNRMYYQGYYHANKYNFKIFNKNIRFSMAKDVTKLFVNMRSDKLHYKNIKKYCYNLSQLTGLNTYLDMSIFYSSFFELGITKKYPATRMVKEYINYMNSFISDFDTQTNSVYENKILLVNFDALNINVKDPINYERNFTFNIFAILFYLLRYEITQFNNLGFKILLRSNKYTIFIDPIKCDKDSYKVLRTTIIKMKQDLDKDEVISAIVKGEDIPKEDIENLDAGKISSKAVGIVNLTKDNISDAQEAVSDTDVKLDAVSKAVSADIIGDLKNIPSDKKLSYAFTGEQKSVEKQLDEKLEKEVEKTVKKLSKENKINKDTPVAKANEEIRTSLEKDEDFMKNLVISRNNKLTNMMSPSNLARNKMLAEKQAKLEFEGKTINEILKAPSDQVIPTKKIKSDILNENIKELKLPNFDRIYNEKFYDRDIINIINSFKNKSVPVYILDIQKKNTSNVFNKKYTWTVTMEASDRSRHKLQFDVPKFVNDSFMYLNGNSKNMYKQLFLLPISKTEPSVVQICTNYNKAFIRRLGDKLSPKTERFRKILPKYPKLKVALGDNTKSNNIAITSLEYDELAKVYTDISAKGIVFSFNLQNMYNMMDTLKIKKPTQSNLIPIGMNSIDKGKPEIILLDTDKNIVQGSDLSLLDYIVNTFSKYVDPNIEKDYFNENVGKKYMYNSVTIMGKAIPLIILLSYVEGISQILRKAEINHEFSDTRPQLKESDKNNKGIIEFADGFLLYDKYPYANSLLLNGLNSIPTKNYNYSDLDDKETFLEIFQELFGMKKLANALDNFYDLLLDPITIGVLEDLSMPTDFVGVFLYANKLLEDNEFIRQMTASTNRIRSNEIVSAIVYKTLATAYENYRLTAGNKNPQKMSIPQDQVLKNLLMLNTVEDYSTLGPVLEAEKVRAVSSKGHSGMNLDRAYTLENRSFDKSMLGILSMSSPPTGSVGVVRQLPLDSNILSAKGYLKSYENSDDITQSNMCSPAEEMIPMCTTKDDAPRMRNCPL